jgi:hypothetical protein
MRRHPRGSLALSPPNGLLNGDDGWGGCVPTSRLPVFPRLASEGPAFAGRSDRIVSASKLGSPTDLSRTAGCDAGARGCGKARLRVSAVKAW